MAVEDPSLDPPIGPSATWFAGAGGITVDGLAYEVTVDEKSLFTLYLKTVTLEDGQQWKIRRRPGRISLLTSTGEVVATATRLWTGLARLEIWRVTHDMESYEVKTHERSELAISATLTSESTTRQVGELALHYRHTFSLRKVTRTKAVEDHAGVLDSRWMVTESTPISVLILFLELALGGWANDPPRTGEWSEVELPKGE